jgi:hypothetical protein
MPRSSQFQKAIGEAAALVHEVLAECLHRRSPAYFALPTTRAYLQATSGLRFPLVHR